MSLEKRRDRGPAYAVFAHPGWKTAFRQVDRELRGRRDEAPDAGRQAVEPAFFFSVDGYGICTNDRCIPAGSH